MKKHSYKFNRKQYNKYVKAYKQAESEMEEKGLEMNDGFMLSYKEFKANYQKKKLAYKEDIERGFYNSEPNPVKELVSEQQYSLSWKEAWGYRRVLRLNEDKLGNVNFDAFRNLGREDLKAYFDEMNLWNDAKIIAKENGKTISQTFFGSK